MPEDMSIITPNVYWELDFWGKVRRSNQAARAEIAASEEALRMVQVGLITAVADGYFQLLDYDQRLEISRRTWETRKESVWIIEQRFEHGTVPEIDLNQAQQQEAIAATAIPYYERMVAQTENYLSILIGAESQEPGTWHCWMNLKELPQIPVGIPSELLQRRPDLLQAEQRVLCGNMPGLGWLRPCVFPHSALPGPWVWPVAISPHCLVGNLLFTALVAVSWDPFLTGERTNEG